MPTLIRWNTRVFAAWIKVVVCTLQCLLGFASAAHAQCGVGWALAAGDGPGAYEICYDESRARTVLFGGVVWENDTWHYSNDTWEWDGTGWTQASPGEPGLGVRVGSTLVYDAVQRRVLLFGGTRWAQNDAGVVGERRKSLASLLKHTLDARFTVTARLETPLLM